MRGSEGRLYLEVEFRKIIWNERLRKFIGIIMWNANQ